MPAALRAFRARLQERAGAQLPGMVLLGSGARAIIATTMRALGCVERRAVEAHRFRQSRRVLHRHQPADPPPARCLWERRPRRDDRSDRCPTAPSRRGRRSHLPAPHHPSRPMKARHPYYPPQAAMSNIGTPPPARRSKRPRPTRPLAARSRLPLTSAYAPVHQSRRVDHADLYRALH